jgi:dihydrofolate reductase
MNMRKIINETFLSLDGVIDPLGFMADFPDDAERDSYVLDVISGSDTLLMGRATYEDWAQIWPTFPEIPGRPKLRDFTARINGMQKLIASTTLKGPLAWNNSEIIKGDVIKAVANLKQQSGKDILMYGSGQLSYALLQAGLMDEFRFWVYPTTEGGGKRVFGDGNKAVLKLIRSKPLPNGVVIYTYQPAKSK